MGHLEIVVIGASAGGVEALRSLVSRLPAGFPAPVMVVLHVPASHPSLLPAVLSAAGPLPACHAHDGKRIERGHIYVAPPDHHLQVTPGRMWVRRGPRENHCRPAVNPLFRSAAEAYGPGVAGVQLSGMLDDGVSGLIAIKGAGGLAVAQEPAQALFPSMPQSAIERVPGLDYVLPIEKIALLLGGLTAGDSVLERVSL